MHKRKTIFDLLIATTIACAGAIQVAHATTPDSIIESEECAASLQVRL